MQGTKRLELAIGLPLRNRELLTNLLEELYNPASANFRKFLTPQQFAERFGPTEQDYQSVMNFARSNNLALSGTHLNRLVLDVNGTVTDIERAFHLKLRVYAHPNEPRAFYAPDVEPSLDASVPVLSVAGLDDFSLPRPMDLRAQLSRATWDRKKRSDSTRESRPALDGTGSGPAGTFIGSDFRTTYAPGMTLTGLGESVGLLELDSYYSNDISEYEDLAGLPSVPLTKVLVNGFNRSPGSNNGEVALDIEMVISMAPGLASVIVYEGRNGIDILNRMATDNLARQLSSSWSFGNSVDATREQIFQQFAAQGQSFFQASGDSGAYGSISFAPADDPFVTAVGGTSLATIGPEGGWSSETVWFGSGGGVSLSYSIPIWQQALSTTANRGSPTMRNGPDVAAVADKIWVVANNGEQGTVAGTSAAAPLWAGFAALVNQQAAANHKPAIGFLNPALYTIGQGPAYHSAFHDITEGNNTNTASPNRFYAVPGYDLCTGWGTPNGSNLVDALLAPADALQVSPDSDVLTSGAVGGPFTPGLTGFLLTNSGTTSLPWALSSASSWLEVSPSSGIILTGAPATLVSLRLNTAASNLNVGSYTAVVRFTNLNNGFTQSRQLVLNVVAFPLITRQPVGQRVPFGATVQFTVETATNTLNFYQWQADGTNLDESARITGVQAPILTIVQASPQDSRTYSVLVTNAAGFALSAGAELIVTSSPPVVAIQPTSQTVLPGATATFSALAFGDPPLYYQWHGNGTNLIDTANLSGTTSSILNLKSVSYGDAGSYSVTISNSLGSKTSVEAELKVVFLTSPEIVQSTVLAFNGTNGAHPNGLTRGLDGKIYGTTQTGGGKDAGTIFQLNPNGQAKLLFSFGGTPDGEKPNSSLVQDAEGSLLGTTYGGGSNGFGTLFKLGADGVMSTLLALDHTNGVLPNSGLVQALDGKLYGTAYEGGVFHYGTVFRFDMNSGFNVVLPFASTNGGFPHAELLRSADGSLYGTTYKGGFYDKGTVFHVSTNGVASTLASFDGTNGAFPVAALTEAVDGSLYGTTAYGGIPGLGSIFRILPNGFLTNLYSFSGAADGRHPRAALVEGSDGNLYGTTSDGGSLGAGTVFRVNPEGLLTTIAQFDGFNGVSPEAPLLEDTDGSFLGVTHNGGLADQGVIFRLSTSASAPHITSQPAGQVTYAGSSVVLSVASYGSPPLQYQWQEDGTNIVDNANLHGSTTRILILTNVSPANAGSYSVIVSNSHGSMASSGALLQVRVSAPVIVTQPADQTLLPGSTAVFHASVLGNVPLVYQWQVNGTNVTDTSNRSGTATDTLTITKATEADNGLYTLVVTNSLGRTNTDAALSVIPVSAPGTRLGTFYSFTGGEDGRIPSELVDGHDGFLYGTTQFGGSLLDGSVFRVGTNGGFMTLVSFDLTNGGSPLAGLILSTNGDFYGTSSAGGAFGFGTVWVMTPAGLRSNVYNFKGGDEGGTPAATLVEGADGNLYGSTRDGGITGLGTLFRIAPNGTSTVLHPLAGIDGASSGGALLESADGALYGTTTAGGLFGRGSVFRLSPAGLFTNIYSFTGGMDGYNPAGGLALGDDGALYGTTLSNTIRGFVFNGTLFRLSTNGLLTTLYSLNFTDGSYPAAGLIQGADGNFYGTTRQGGPNDYGTLFRMTPNGTVSTLVEFDGFNDGANPLTALTWGSDNNLYGTTSSGGPGGYGTIFRLSFVGAPQISAQPVSRTAVTGGKTAFSVAVTGATPFWFQWLKNGTNVADGPSIQGSSTRILTLADLALADSGSYSVVVSNISGSITSQPVPLNVDVSPPAFQTIARTGGNLVVAWSTAVGRTYQLQSNAGFGSSNWVNVGNSITATGSSLQRSIPIGTNSNQYYRVVLLP
jgi:uncharacterized repeat protein (TIGR03803 family)